MAFFKIKGGDEEEQRRMAEMFGPGHVDAQLRQTLQMLWFSMPKSKRTVDEVDREFRRLVDRALRDMRDDSASLGSGAS